MTVSSDIRVFSTALKHVIEGFTGRQIYSYSGVKDVIGSACTVSSSHFIRGLDRNIGNPLRCD